MPEPLVIPSNKLSDTISDEERGPPDFHIKIKKKKLHVHKSVLIDASDYFRAMLQSGTKESIDEKLRIHKTRTDVAQRIIRYFYGKDLHIEWQRIEDFVHIIELWQLDSMKLVLEEYIAKNMSPHDCMHWFFCADTYHMACLQKKASEMIISHFEEISKRKDFSSLSLRDLRVLYNAIGKSGCNPAYAKSMLNAYGTMAIPEQDTREQIQDVIESLFASSFILIGEIVQCDSTDMKVFTVNLASDTVAEIGTFPDKRPMWNNIACYVMDSHVFYDNGERCGLLDLVTLKVSDLPSLKGPIDGIYTETKIHKSFERAVAIGTKPAAKIFVIRAWDYGHYCLDLRTKKWTKCASKMICWLACAVSVGSTIFVLEDYSEGTKDDRNGVQRPRKFLRPLSYDTRKDTWGTTPGPRCEIPNRSGSAVVINQDLYYVSKDDDHKNNDLFIMRYSTTREEWTTIAKPRIQKNRNFTALSVNGNLVLYDAFTNAEERLQVYHSSTDTWAEISVQQPKTFSVRFACSV